MCECMAVIASTFQHNGDVSKQVFCSLCQCFCVCADLSLAGHVEGDEWCSVRTPEP